jgi:hypothetical protein
MGYLRCGGISFQERSFVRVARNDVRITVSALLDDIINLAIDGKQPLPDILRKCLLLGHELKNETLKTWANQELNGYSSIEPLPQYRIIPAEARGNFTGSFGAGARNWPIPSAGLKKEHRDFGEKVYLMQAVSAFQDVLSTDQDEIRFPWPNNLALVYQTHFFQGRYVLVSAWQEISKSAIVEMLDSIRNRTLNMALQLKDELGTSYTSLRKIESKETQASIQNIIFQNTGGSTNVAFGEANLDASGQSQTVIAAGDRQALDRILSNAGLEKSDLDSLTEAIKADGKKPGNKISEWVKEKGSKVLSGGINVGTKIGSEILTAWIKQHYGL